MRKHRLKFDPSLVVSCDLTNEGTHEAMRQLLSLKRKPTAIVLFNDYVALYAVQFAMKNNLRINKDLTFVSYANLPLSHYTAHPPIASVEQFPYQQGQKATEILLKLFSKYDQDPQQDQWHTVTVDSKLMIHASGK